MNQKQSDMMTSVIFSYKYFINIVATQYELLSRTPNICQAASNAFRVRNPIG